MLTYLGNNRNRALQTWVWAIATQKELDSFASLHNSHRIRKQKSSALPAGGSPNSFYTLSYTYGRNDQLIPVDTVPIPDLSAVEFFRFGSEETHELATELYSGIGSPEITTRTASDMIKDMIKHMEDHGGDGV